MVVHGDDFISAGGGDNLAWLAETTREARASAASQTGTWLRQ